MKTRTLIVVLLALTPDDALAQRNQLTIEAGVVRGAIGYARQMQPRLYAGIEAGFGFPQIDRTLVPEKRSDGNPSFEEYLHIGLFVRYAAAPAVEIDAGIRGSIVDLWPCGASDCWPVGFAGAYVQPMVGWRRLKIGPRITTGWAAEGETGRDSSTGVLSLSPLNVRLMFPW